MADEKKTIQNLIEEIAGLKKRIGELETGSDRVDMQWQSTLDAVPDLIALIDADHRILRANRAMLLRLRCSPDDMRERFCYELLHGRSSPPDFCPHAKTMNSGRIEHADVFEEHLGGHFDVTTAPIHDAEGIMTGSVHIARDITDRKRAEEALRQSELILKEILETTLAGFWDWNLVENTEYLSPTFKLMFGYEDHEMENSPEAWQNIIFPEDLPGVLECFDRHIKSGGREPFYNEIRYRHKDGSTVWVICTGRVIEWAEDGTAVRMVGCHVDITERKQAEETIRQMAYHDALTGLPNRLLFSDRLGIALARARRNHKTVAVAMLDLDHFKDVNDTLGHDVGDRLLKAAAERLNTLLRKSDTVARFGGDEFVLILPDLKGREDVIPVAQKVLDNFRKPILVDTHQLSLTTSIGIALYPHNGTDETTLLKNADIAMYKAKQGGRDRCHFRAEE